MSEIESDTKVEPIVASPVEELTKDDFEKVFGDIPLTITDSEVKD